MGALKCYPLEGGLTGVFSLPQGSSLGRKCSKCGRPV